MEAFFGALGKLWEASLWGTGRAVGCSYLSKQKILKRNINIHVSMVQYMYYTLCCIRIDTIVRNNWRLLGFWEAGVNINWDVLTTKVLGATHLPPLTRLPEWVPSEKNC